jgi:reverse gyrase
MTYVFEFILNVRLIKDTWLNIALSNKHNEHLTNQNLNLSLFQGSMLSRIQRKKSHKLKKGYMTGILNSETVKC